MYKSWLQFFKALQDDDEEETQDNNIEDRPAESAQEDSAPSLESGSLSGSNFDEIEYLEEETESTERNDRRARKKT